MAVRGRASRLSLFENIDEARKDALEKYGDHFRGFAALVAEAALEAVNQGAEARGEALVTKKQMLRNSGTLAPSVAFNAAWEAVWSLVAENAALEMPESSGEPGDDFDEDNADGTR